MASKKRMEQVIIKKLLNGNFYTKDDIADIIDRANILSANDYNPPKSGKTIKANWEITLDFLLSKMVKEGILARNNTDYELF